MSFPCLLAIKSWIGIEHVHRVMQNKVVFCLRLLGRVPKTEFAGSYVERRATWQAGKRAALMVDNGLGARLC